MKKIPAFSFLEDGKLAEIVLYMKKEKKKRTEMIYKQGERTEYLFMLIEG